MTFNKNKAIKLLNETALHYKRSNRSLESGMICEYVPSTNKLSEGCAIGRKLTKKEKDLILSKGLNFSTLGDVWYIVKDNKSFKGLSRSFLSALQGMHDECSNWGNEGISHSGLVEYNRIKQNILKDNY